MVFLQDVHYLSSGSFGRVLMPPPPPLFVAPGPVARKRPREATVEDRLSLPISTASTGMHFSIHEALWEFQSSYVFSSVACCIKWHLPPCGIGVGVGDLCYTLIGWTNWPAFLVYVFCLSLVFSLDMHLLDLPVMDVCCGAISFDLSPGCGSYEIKNYC